MNPQEQFSDRLARHETNGNRSPKQRSRQKARRAQRTAGAIEQKRAAHGTLARTRSLVLAALRVWELKQGLRH